MLSWASRFNICCFLDNHQYESRHHSYECLAGVGAINIFKTTDDFFSSLELFNQLNDDWIFGHFSYDVKNVIEPGLVSLHHDGINFPDYYLFVPQVVLQLDKEHLVIGVTDADAAGVYNAIISIKPTSTPLPQIQITPRLTKDEYIHKVKQLIEHIQRGNCYEINFCQEFYGYGTLHAEEAYRQLTMLSPNPFSAFYKVDDCYLLCSSPERYIAKEGNTIISQPIKGTLARSADSSTDNNIRTQLYNSKKERSENVMIVDLVRNDLSKVCTEGTVEVEELFGIYSFPYVHQMISTVSGKLKNSMGIAQVLKATFPMGSMTGAPKRKVMELIEKFEVSKRGIYSGAVGYISPQKNFDFNVVIRSIVYNRQSGYLSYHVGSAITSQSDPLQEYDECLLKAKAITKIFEGN